MLFCMQKFTGEVWDPWRRAILALSTLICMQKPQMRAGTIETNNTDAKHAVLHAEIH